MMPVARFQFPDGRIGRFEVPEGTSPQDAQRMINEQLQGSASDTQSAPAPQEPSRLSPGLEAFSVPQSRAGQPALFGDAARASEQMTREPSAVEQDPIASMFQAEKEYQAAARQGTSWEVRHPDGQFMRPVLGRATANEYGEAMYVDDQGKSHYTDKNKHVILRDPETDQELVFARTPETDQNALLSAGQQMVPFMVTAPITGPARAAAATTATGDALRSQRAADAALDVSAFARQDTPLVPGAFSSGTTRGAVKNLGETALIGKPIEAGIERSYKGASEAVERVARSIGGEAREADIVGTGVKEGLHRFRTAGLADLEPEQLSRLDIQPTQPVAREAIMSKGAAQRAREAEGIRRASGVADPSVQPSGLTQRTTAESLDDTQIDKIIRAPSSETSFETKAQALFERAHRHLPTRLRANNTVNPNLFEATATKKAFDSLRKHQARTRLPGGVVGGRYSGMADRLKTNVKLEDLRAMRSAIGQDLGEFALYEKGLSRGQLNALYKAMSNDLEVIYTDLANRAWKQTRVSKNAADYVKPEVARKADKALREFKRANAYYKAGIERMDRFLKIVDVENPQTAVDRLIRATKAGEKGNIGLFRTAWRSLRPEQQSSLRSYILRSLVKPIDSAQGVVKETKFSPSSFSTRVTKMDSRIFDLLFSGKHKQDVQDLVRIANRMANVEAMANVSKSGRSAANVMGMLASLGLITSGKVVTLAAVGGGAFGLSYLLSRPSYTRWTVRYLRAKQQALRAPQQLTAEVAVEINRLQQLARQDPALRPVYSLIAEENGITERPYDAKQKEDQTGREQSQPYQR